MNVFNDKVILDNNEWLYLDRLVGIYFKLKSNKKLCLCDILFLKNFFDNY